MELKREWSFAAEGAVKNKRINPWMVECLESRKLLASTAALVLAVEPTVSFPLPSQIVKKVLYVEGTHRGDSITLSVRDDGFTLVTVNANSAAYDPALYTSIVISGGRGDDVTSIGSSRRQILTKTIQWGGLGDDKLTGGQGGDELHGGVGNDVLLGGEGNDVLLGEKQGDILRGNAGDDSLFGGDGDDLISGDEGTDVLYGGTGFDRFVIEIGETRKQANDPGRGDTLLVNDGTVFHKS